jgi:hypothetical protein
MLELPNAERGKKKALCSAQRSDSGQLSLRGLSAVGFPGTAALPLGFANTARGFADRKVAGIIHGG